MDTDNLSDMAYDIIGRAARGCDTLKAELGALSRDFDREDDWLQGIRRHLQEIIADPDVYVDYWDLEEAERVCAGEIKALAGELCDQITIVLATPLNERGKRGW